MDLVEGRVSKLEEKLLEYLYIERKNNGKIKGFGDKWV